MIQPWQNRSFTLECGFNSWILIDDSHFHQKQVSRSRVILYSPEPPDTIRCQTVNIKFRHSSPEKWWTLNTFVTQNRCIGERTSHLEHVSSAFDPVFIQPPQPSKLKTERNAAIVQTTMDLCERVTFTANIPIIISGLVASATADTATAHQLHIWLSTHWTFPTSCVTSGNPVYRVLFPDQFVNHQRSCIVNKFQQLYKHIASNGHSPGQRDSQHNSSSTLSCYHQG